MNEGSSQAYFSHCTPPLPLVSPGNYSIFGLVRRSFIYGIMVRMSFILNDIMVRRSFIYGFMVRRSIVSGGACKVVVGFPN